MLFGGPTPLTVVRPAAPEQPSPPTEFTVEEADAAAAEMREAGYDPQKPYPGPSYPWDCVCMRCGGRRRPSLMSVRRGTRCRHGGRSPGIAARASPEPEK